MLFQTIGQILRREELEEERVQDFFYIIMYHSQVTVFKKT